MKRIAFGIITSLVATATWCAEQREIPTTLSESGKRIIRAVLREGHPGEKQPGNSLFDELKELQRLIGISRADFGQLVSWGINNGGDISNPGDSLTLLVRTISLRRYDLVPVILEYGASLADTHNALNMIAIHNACAAKTTCVGLLNQHKEKIESAINAHEDCAINLEQLSQV